jgi:tRNA threonylcarbamoyladenosine biosynthesis protein TsaB
LKPHNSTPKKNNTLVYLLHLETATAVCSVSLSGDGKPLGVKVIHEGFRHAENLMFLVDQLLTEQAVSYADLQGVVVSNGPGSYTGLRIGLSTAKGICYAREIPLITLGTLDIMAAGFIDTYPEFKGYIVPMIDARRMEVYTAVYDHQNQKITADFPCILDAESYSDYSSQEIAFFGDGAPKYQAVCPYSTARFDLQPDWNAAHMIDLAYHKFQQKEFADLAYSEPDYLKPFFTTAKPVEE